MPAIERESAFYHVYTKDGEMLPVDNPARLPTVQEIDRIEEPMIIANMHAPNEWFATDCFERGIDTIIHLYDELA